MFSALSNFVFGASSLFGSHSQSDNIKASIWKDKKLCFDLRPHDLELNRGEQLIGCFYPIEDVKGNQDELGLLEVTNLRLIWICVKKRKVNLSIGWRTVTMVYEQSLKDTLYGTSSSLFVLSKSGSTKYEFVFARKAHQVDILSSDTYRENWALISQLRRLSQERATIVSHLSPICLDDPFDVTMKVWQSYNQTPLFRHCRSNISYLIAKPPDDRPPRATADYINRLPCEEIIDTFNHVEQSVAPNIKHMGTLLVTNIRLVWIDTTCLTRNLSIPYIRIESLKLKSHERISVGTSDYLTSSAQVEFCKSKSGAANATATAKMIFEEIQNLYNLHKLNPRFGPESREECRNIMSHLQPLDDYFEFMDGILIKGLDNLGPEPNSTKVKKLPATQRTATINIEMLSEKSTGRIGIDDDEIDQAEKELDGYATKLINYLEERPLESDNELIYSKELGLAMEKPANGASINSIWNIDV